MSTKDNCQSNLGGLTDSDKAGESSMDTNNYFGRRNFLKKKKKLVLYVVCEQTEL